MVPELQTLRTWVITLRADETSSVSVGCTTGLDVQVMTTLSREVNHYVVTKFFFSCISEYLDCQEHITTSVVSRGPSHLGRCGTKVPFPVNYISHHLIPVTKVSVEATVKITA